MRTFRWKTITVSQGIEPGFKLMPFKSPKRKLSTIPCCLVSLNNEHYTNKQAKQNQRHGNKEQIDSDQKGGGRG